MTAAVSAHQKYIYSDPNAATHMSKRKAIATHGSGGNGSKGAEWGMVKLHSTRLMRGGEVALWLNGEIVWTGSAGAALRNISFDAVSMHVEDATRISSVDGSPLTPAHVLQTLADWWN
jgi:hypothetical protein